MQLRRQITSAGRGISFFPRLLIILALAAMTVLAFSAVASHEFLNYDDTIHALAAITRHQVSCWHDSRSLFERALELDSENHMALNNLAVLLAAEGKSEKAIGYCRRSLPLVPNQLYVHVNLGNRYFHLRRFAEAEKYYRQHFVSTRISPPVICGWPTSVSCKDETLKRHSSTARSWP